MPKYKKETQKLKDNKIIKDYIDSDFNQQQLAKKLGISQPAVSQRMARLAETGTFSKLLDKAGISDERLVQVLKDGLEANKVVGYLNSKVKGTDKVSDEFVEVADHHVRHRFLETALEIKGHIKQNNKNANVSAIIINIRNQSGLFTEDQAKHLSHQSG